MQLQNTCLPFEGVDLRGQLRQRRDKLRMLDAVVANIGGKIRRLIVADAQRERSVVIYERLLNFQESALINHVIASTSFLSSFSSQI